MQRRFASSVNSRRSRGEAAKPVTIAQIESAVRKAASSLGFLGEDGALRTLDSLGIIDLITEIEETLQLEVPPRVIRQDNFVTVERIATTLLAVANEQ